MFWQHNDDFLPDNPSLAAVSGSAITISDGAPHLCVADVMHLIKHDKFYIANEISTLVEHTSENFRGHDETVRFGIDLHVTGENPDRGRRKCVFEVAELLIGERLNG